MRIIVDVCFGVLYVVCAFLMVTIIGLKSKNIFAGQFIRRLILCSARQDSEDIDTNCSKKKVGRATRRDRYMYVLVQVYIGIYNQIIYEYYRIREYFIVVEKTLVFG